MPSCVNCGSEFVAKRSNQVHCSYECKSKWNTILSSKKFKQECEVCHTEFTRAIKQKCCSVKCSRVITTRRLHRFSDNGNKTHKTCSKCKEIRPLNTFRKRGDYLRSQCLSCDSVYEKEKRDKNKARENTRKHYSKPENKEKRRQYQLKHYKPKGIKYGPNSKIKVRPCKVTGLLFTQSKASLKSQAEIDLIAQRKQLREFNKVPKILVHCDECASEFIKRRNKTNFCSVQCSTRYNKRITRKMERARLRAVSIERVDPIVVFENFNWHCAKCKIETPKSMRGKGTYNSPELDHIMPLSKGGEHSYQNTQLLCRSCNSEKSNKIEVTQFKINYAKTGIRAYGLSHQAR